MVFIGDTVTIVITVQDSLGVALDISTASTKQIIVEPPSAVAVATAATFTTTGADGKIQIDYAAITVAGQYEVQGKIVIAGKTYHTAISSFLTGTPLL